MDAGSDAGSSSAYKAFQEPWSWVVGVGGHAYTQISDDECSFSDCAAAAQVQAAHGNRGRTLSIGPAVQYNSSRGWLFSAKWQQESGVRNRSEGEAFWLKFTTAL